MHYGTTVLAFYFILMFIQISSLSTDYEFNEEKYVEDNINKYLDFYENLQSEDDVISSTGSGRIKRFIDLQDGENMLQSLLRKVLSEEDNNRLHTIMSAPEIIKAHGYPCEIHEVTTADGYILELHRIPGGGKTRSGESSPLPNPKFSLTAHNSNISSNNILQNKSKLKNLLRLQNERMDRMLAEESEVLLGIKSLLAPITNYISLLINSLTRLLPFAKSAKNRNQPRFINRTARVAYQGKSKLFKLKKSHGGSKIKEGNARENRVTVKGVVTGKPVALVHHGLLSSSANFVTNDAKHSLAYILADAGYDVWMANWRGNSYSRKHVKLSPDEAEFWDFSLDEIMRYDVPAIIKYILNKSQREDLHYVGHSLGCVVLWGAINMYPEINSRVRVMVALAPAGFMDNAVGLFKAGSVFFRKHYSILEKFGIRELLPPNWSRTALTNFLCNPKGPFLKICFTFLPLFFGELRGNHDPRYTDFLLSHFPSGSSSIRIFSQLGQFIGAHGMQMFDFGRKGNIRKYKQATPPKYSFNAVSIPVAVIWGQSDSVITSKDVLQSVKALPNVILNYRAKDPGFTHNDFLFSEGAHEDVYNVILEVFDRYK